MTVAQDDTVWVAEPAFQRPPFSMVHHEPGQDDPEFGRMSVCLYVHEWVEMRRDVAESFTRPCKVCRPRMARWRAGTAALVVVP